jgi:uncharacterized protein (TIGR00730 family)
VSPVLGPDGSGVLVVTTDPSAAIADRDGLELGGLEAILPREATLRAGPATPVGPDPTAVVSFWARACRRTAIARGENAAYAVAEPDGTVTTPVASGDLVEVAGRAAEAAPPRRVAVFGGAWVTETEAEHEAARRLGAAAARAGADVITGGYQGVMAAASRGAVEAAGTVVGATITSFSAMVPVNGWLTHEVESGDLFGRLPLISDADAWVAFAGGVGTLAEVALCWNLVQTASASARPLIVVGERWEALLAEFRKQLLITDERHLDLIRLAERPEDALTLLATVTGSPG